MENSCGMLLFFAFDLISFQYLSFKHNPENIVIISLYSHENQLMQFFFIKDYWYFSLLDLYIRIFRRSYLYSNKQIPKYDTWENSITYLKVQHSLDSYCYVIKSKYIETLKNLIFFQYSFRHGEETGRYTQCTDRLQGPP